MSVCPFVSYAFLNGWTELYEIFCVCLSRSWKSLDCQLDPAGSTRKGAKTGILLCMVNFFVFKWLLLITEKIISLNGCHWK